VPLAPLDGLSQLSDATCGKLRERFTVAGFTLEALAETDPIVPGEFDAVRQPMVQWTLERRPEPWAPLVRLFCYLAEVPEAALAAVLGAELVAALKEAGVLGPGEDGALRSAFSVLPFYHDLWILSDDFDAGREAAMGPGQTTTLLAGAMPRAIGGRFLDVGCGAGSFALTAMRRGASAAVGTDVNPRAIAIARFNARLNGSAATFVEGDLVEPVRRERFDLVFSQPPYIVRPPDTPHVTYAHGGARGDELALRLMGELPAVLSARGRALLMMDVPLIADDPVLRRFKAAIGGARVDLLLLSTRGASLDQESVAHTLLETRSFGPAYAPAVRRYRQQFHDLGVTGILQTLVVLRQAAGRTTGIAASMLVDSLLDLNWEAIEGVFDALDLAALDDRGLKTRGVSFSSRATWVEERRRPDPASEGRVRVRFRPGALGVEGELSDASAALLEALDGSTSVGAAIVRYAELCECAEAEVEQKVLEFVRATLRSGVLEARRANLPATSPGPAARASA